jgi:hypothetical protein
MSDQAQPMTTADAPIREITFEQSYQALIRSAQSEKMVSGAALQRARLASGKEIGAMAARLFLEAKRSDRGRRRLLLVLEDGLAGIETAEEVPVSFAEIYAHLVQKAKKRDAAPGGTQHGSKQ